MKILILSVGTRNTLIEEFKQQLNAEGGQVIAADCSQYAPALYCADKFYIVPECNEKNYIASVINICISEGVNAIVSLLDPELSVLSKNIEKFEEIGVTLVLSSYETNELCYNKFEMYRILKKHNIPHILTFDNPEDVITAIEQESVKFPVVLKDKKGSASQNIRVIHSARELFLLFKNNREQLVQEYIEGDEYGIDAYIDAVSGEVISIFQKKKLRMRAGETDKSIAIRNKKLEKAIMKLCECFDFKYVIDVDAFEVNGEFFISEVNPRFGGGYIHAARCGMDFVKKIINNLKGNINEKDIGNYPVGSVMMKYSEAKFLNCDGE